MPHQEMLRTIEVPLRAKNSISREVHNLEMNNLRSINEKGLLVNGAKQYPGNQLQNTHKKHQNKLQTIETIDLQALIKVMAHDIIEQQEAIEKQQNIIQSIKSTLHE